MKKMLATVALIVATTTSAFASPMDDDIAAGYAVVSNPTERYSFTSEPTLLETNDDVDVFLFEDESGREGNIVRLSVSIIVRPQVLFDPEKPVSLADFTFVSLVNCDTRDTAVELFEMMMLGNRGRVTYNEPVFRTETPTKITKDDVELTAKIDAYVADQCGW